MSKIKFTAMCKVKGAKTLMPVTVRAEKKEDVYGIVKKMMTAKAKIEGTTKFGIVCNLIEIVSVNEKKSKLSPHMSYYSNSLGSVGWAR
jgi:hypothetical protein